MKLFFFSLASLLVVTFSGSAQSETMPLGIGDPAPAMQVRKWIKGTPVNTFEKGKVYVVEFWATWCLPCIAGMPHLSKLANDYKGKVTVAGISVMERSRTTPEQIDSFVQSMGKKMDYHVAAEDSNYMARQWLNAAGERGIPFAFVIEQQGRVAWIGHPKKLDDILPKVVAGKWDLSEAKTERENLLTTRKYDNEAYARVNHYMGNPGKPDSALLAINKMVSEHPELKYAPRVAHYTFWSLIKTDPEKATSYGKALMKSESYEDPPYKSITDAVSYMIEIKKQNLPSSTLIIAAMAYQAQIDKYPWSMNIPATYEKIADLYHRAGELQKSSEAAKKAIEAMRSKKEVTPAELKALLLRMQKYSAQS